MVNGPKASPESGADWMLDQLRRHSERESEERRQAEFERRCSEERLRSVVALLPAGVYTCDAEGRITFFNERAAELWGGEPKINDSVERYFPIAKMFLPGSSEAIPPEQTPIARAIREGKSFREFEIIITRKNGVPFAARISVDPIQDASGRISGAVSLFQDISERKQTEIASLRLAAIVESSDDAIVSKDLNGIINSWNNGAERIFGYRSEEVLGQSILIIIPPDRQNEETSILERIRRGERVDHFETIRIRKDGNPIDVSLTISPVKDKDGRIIGVSKVARDITQQRRAQQRLTTQSAVNRILAETLSVKETSARILKSICETAGWEVGSLWLVDSQKQHLKCFEQWHLPNGGFDEFAAASRLCCFERGTGLPGRLWERRQPLWITDLPAEPNFPRAALAAKGGLKTAFGFPVMAENSVLGILEFFSRFSKPADEEFLQMVSAVGGQIGQFLERQKAEQALKEIQKRLQEHTQELERKVEERTAKLRETIGQLEAFSYSVSHDMRAPLRAMQGFSETLVLEYGEKFDDQGKDYLHRIHRAAHRLDLLIRDVLTYSRIAKEDLVFRPLDLDKFVEEIVQSYPELQNVRGQIQVQRPLGMIEGHEAFLSQVIANLLSNAFKFVVPTVVPQVRIWSEPVGEMLRLNISDNGLGIAPEHQERIFQIFGRVYSDKKFEGTGIGLAIVKNAVERMGGQVGVQSTLGHGSRFWLTLRRL